MTTDSLETDNLPKVLVVDDSPLDRALVKGLLSKRVDAEIVLAENAESALRLLEESPPALVLTDVQMPGLDGLGLTARLRETVPHIPVVVMTAHGSEELAADALRTGAAHYVPKAKLAKQLTDTVRDVLVLATENQRKLRLRNYWQRSEVEYRLGNDVSLIPALVSELQDGLVRAQACDATTRMRVGVALHEALRNAVDHGNLELDSKLREEDGDAYYNVGLERRRLEPYANRQVHVRVRESPGESSYVIRDEGPGFDPGQLEYDPDDPANMTRPSGRGLFLIRTFMDEVRFNESGNEITLVHRRATSPD